MAPCAPTARKEIANSRPLMREMETAEPGATPRDARVD